MGNPFGKIIQNGVEYDVSQFAHKIEVTANKNETFGSALTRLYNAIKTAIPSFSDIKCAELHIISNVSGARYNERYTLSVSQGNDLLTFIGAYNLASALNMMVVRLAQSNCGYAVFKLSSTGVEYSNQASSSTHSGEKFVLYYS